MCSFEAFCGMQSSCVAETVHLRTASLARVYVLKLKLSFHSAVLFSLIFIDFHVELVVLGPTTYVSKQADLRIRIQVQVNGMQMKCFAPMLPRQRENNGF